jgi:hypothetical protein
MRITDHSRGKNAARGWPGPTDGIDDYIDELNDRNPFKGA